MPEKEAVLDEGHAGTAAAAGTFAALLPKLSSLAELGVTAPWTALVLRSGPR